MSSPSTSGKRGKSKELGSSRMEEDQVEAGSGAAEALHLQKTLRVGGGD